LSGASESSIGFGDRLRIFGTAEFGDDVLALPRRDGERHVLHRRPRMEVGHPVEALERADRGALSRPDAGIIKCTVIEIPSKFCSEIPEIPAIYSITTASRF
jgi:hypothetical protein